MVTTLAGSLARRAEPPNTAPVIRRRLTILETAMPIVAITLPFSVPASTLAPCWAAARAGSRRFEILPERNDMNMPGMPNMGYMAMGSTSQDTRVPDIS